MCSILYCLNKIFAIIILSLHFFNIGGYELLFRFQQQKNSKQTSQKIEKGNYSNAELVLLKVPVAVPYSTEQSEYEQYDGEIEWGGAHYNYVKRKIQNDTLYLLCLPNERLTKLRKAQHTYADKVNDFPSSSQKNNDGTIKKIISSGEYDQVNYLYSVPTILAVNNQIASRFSSVLIHTDIETIIQPPKPHSI